MLTASTATFMALLSNTLKCETHFATMSYSDNTIKEKFLILASTIRLVNQCHFKFTRNSGQTGSCLGVMTATL